MSLFQPMTGSWVCPSSKPAISDSWLRCCLIAIHLTILFIIFGCTYILLNNKLSKSQSRFINPLVSSPQYFILQYFLYLMNSTYSCTFSKPFDHICNHIYMSLFQPMTGGSVCPSSKPAISNEVAL